MKTKEFLEELRKYGWQISRDGQRHIIIENVLFQADRPMALRRQDIREIDPHTAAIQCRQAGLTWDNHRRQARLNPNHPYFSRYQRALGGSELAA